MRDESVQSPACRLRYKIGDRLQLLGHRNRPAVITQIWPDSSGVYQFVLSDPDTGHDICRSTQNELDAHTTRAPHVNQYDQGPVGPNAPGAGSYAESTEREDAQDATDEVRARGAR